MMPLTPQALIELTNTYRVEQGLPPVSANSALMKAAQERANDMAKTGRFSHEVATTTPGVKWNSFIDRAGYQYNHAGENLATLFSDAPSTMQAWKQSPLHNKNLVNPRFREVGIAMVPTTYKGQKTFFVVQVFGEPKPVAPTAAITPIKPAAHTAPKPTVPPAPSRPVMAPSIIPTSTAAQSTPQRKAVARTTNPFDGFKLQ